MKLRSAALVASAAFAIATASPASAAKSIISTLPAVASVCSLSLPTPDATACVGYFSGNLLNGSPADILNQQQAVDSLPGSFQWDGNWSGLVTAGNSITSLTNGNQLDFGQTLYGLTIIGAHWGNVPGPAGNVSTFWLFDFGATGVNYVLLDDTQGWSNAALYTTGAPPGVPEPKTWGMMLLGFGAAGYAVRRRRQPKLAQLA